MASFKKRSIRRRLYVAQGGRCCYCQREMWIPGDLSKQEAAAKFQLTPATVYLRSATLEHLNRRADGGDSNSDNVALACHQCNCDRGERNWAEYATVRSFEFRNSVPQ